MNERCVHGSATPCACDSAMTSVAASSTTLTKTIKFEPTQDRCLPCAGRPGQDVSSHGGRVPPSSLLLPRRCRLRSEAFREHPQNRGPALLMLASQFVVRDSGMA